MTELGLKIGIERFTDNMRFCVLTASLIETHDAVAAAVLAELESGHYYIILVNRQIALSLWQCALVEAFRHGHRTDIKLCCLIHDAALLGFTVADENAVFKSLHSLVGEIEVCRRAIRIVIGKDNISDNCKAQVVVRAVV